MIQNAENSQFTLEKSLPSDRYVSREAFEKEKELIFFRDWFCAGREEELPSHGKYKVLDVLGESILVVRTNKGDLQAHYNVCRHRGARLCATPHDTQWNVNLGGGITSPGTIRCPYHQWTYTLEGDLVGAPFLKESEGFRKQNFHLYPVGVETWGGFFFLNLSPQLVRTEQRTLSSQLGPVVERIARYPLQNLRTARRISYEVAANWKIVMENYNECYHCGGVHPELCEIVPDFKRAGALNLDWEHGIPHRLGTYTFTRTGTTDRSPFPGLLEEEKISHKGEIFYPNLMLSLSCDHVAAFTLWPIASDRTRIMCSFLFHPEEIGKPSFDPTDAADFWDLVNRQDWAICERVQGGLKSRVHKFGYYAPMEDQSLDIRRYIIGRLGQVKG